jgi:hypothetical protein
MKIIEAIEDENLFRPFFGKKNGKDSVTDLSTWKRWFTALRCLYGIPLHAEKSKELVEECTGRSANELPKDGFRTALFLTGRRSGKSRIAAAVAGFEALFGGHEKKLARGEVGLVAVVAPTQRQSGVCWNYLRGLFDSSPLLQKEVLEAKESGRLLTLRNGIQVGVLTGDPRTVRGFTLVAAIVDELASFGLDEESSVRSDVELIRAIRPALATTSGRLICISSPYARKGFCFTSYQKFHGSHRGKVSSFSPAWTTLVWKVPSRVMNPTLSEAIIEEAMQEDPASARSEYFAEFRDDVAEFIPRSLVESLVFRGRKGLLPRPHIFDYMGFVDISGGRKDDAALAIAHREDRKVILDHIGIWRAPFNPHAVIAEMASELKRWGLRRVVGDNYSAEFTASAFTSHGIRYSISDRPKAALYRELLPRLCSSEIELLDDECLINQLAGLERRTRSGGQDIIDHPPNGKDDVANAVAGVATLAGRGRRIVGAVSLETFVDGRGLRI